MMGGRGGPERKLVIAAESLGGAEAALAFCREILEWAAATPAGLLIEPDSTALWTSGAHRLVSTRGAVLSVPSPDRLRRIAKGDSSAFGARLERLATALNMPWSCELSAGDLVGTACAATRGDDILLLGQRPISRHRGKVLLVGAEHGTSVASRQLADVLAHALSATVSVCRPESRPGSEDLVELLDRSHAGVVVVDFDDGPFRNEDDLRRVFAAARCTVAALGASRVRRAAVEAAS